MKKIPQARQKNLEYINVPLEIKEIPDKDDNIFRFEGHASTFGNIDLVDDIVEPGAFRESLAKFMPVILWQHDRWEPIGMPEEIREDEKGLFMVGALPKEDTFVSGRVMPQMKIGSIKSMSIGFRPKKSDMDETTGIRRLIEIELREVSLVTFPANPMAMISGFKSMGLSPEDRKEFLVELTKAIGGSPKVYGADDVKELTVRNFENILRESGLFSKDAAVMLANNFKGTGEPKPKIDVGSILKSLNDIEINSQLKSINQRLEN